MPRILLLRHRAGRPLSRLARYASAADPYVDIAPQWQGRLCSHFNVRGSASEAAVQAVFRGTTARGFPLRTRPVSFPVFEVLVSENKQVAVSSWFATALRPHLYDQHAALGRLAEALLGVRGPQRDGHECQPLHAGHGVYVRAHHGVNRGGEPLPHTHLFFANITKSFPFLDADEGKHPYRALHIGELLHSVNDLGVVGAQATAALYRRFGLPSPAGVAENMVMRLSAQTLLADYYADDLRQDKLEQWRHGVWSSDHERYAAAEVLAAETPVSRSRAAWSRRAPKETYTLEDVEGLMRERLSDDEYTALEAQYGGRRPMSPRDPDDVQSVVRATLANYRSRREEVSIPTVLSAAMAANPSLDPLLSEVEEALEHEMLPARALRPGWLDFSGRRCTVGYCFSGAPWEHGQPAPTLTLIAAEHPVPGEQVVPTHRPRHRRGGPPVARGPRERSLFHASDTGTDRQVRRALGCPPESITLYVPNRDLSATQARPGWILWVRGRGLGFPVGTRIQVSAVEAETVRAHVLGGPANEDRCIPRTDLEQMVPLVPRQLDLRRGDRLVLARDVRTDRGRHLHAGQGYRVTAHHGATVRLASGIRVDTQQLIVEDVLRPQDWRRLPQEQRQATAPEQATAAPAMPEPEATKPVKGPAQTPEEPTIMEALAELSGPSEGADPLAQHFPRLAPIPEKPPGGGPDPGHDH